MTPLDNNQKKGLKLSEKKTKADGITESDGSSKAYGMTLYQNA